ncbi:DsbA family oxidoreductase [Curvivirga sp.]|uniref:DsbA family oxidoreductase n=1 Tax=Curvivirga sp. TaxID=2856848 RepID=UPI003B5C2AC7
MKIEIDIFSDPICPWCYIGKKRLEKALANRPDLNIEIRWRAFQLNPSMPELGMDRKTYLENKFGGPGGAAQVYGHIKTTGETEGIDFKFDEIKRTPNTVKAHRLIRFAQSQNAQIAFDLKEELFQAYFMNGKDIGDKETLIEIASAVGMNGTDVTEFLDTEIFKSDIEEEDTTARRLGISGVPFFIVNGQYALSGAQEPSAFEPVFDLALQAASEIESQ